MSEQPVVFDDSGAQKIADGIRRLQQLPLGGQGYPFERDESWQPELYRVRFYNASGTTIPAYGVTLVTVGSTSLPHSQLVASIEDSANDRVCGMVVNGPTAVASGYHGEGYWNVGPVWALYDSTTTPAPGDAYGLKSGGTAGVLYKGFQGFTCVSYTTQGTGSTSRAWFMPQWYDPPRIIGHARASNMTVTYSASTQIIPLTTAGNGTNGVWPSYTMPLTIERDTPATGRMTVRRSGMWRVDARWSSISARRFNTPYQSKVNRTGIALYKNGSATNSLSDYFHFSLANADTAPSAGVAIPMNGSLSTALYLAKDDVIDLRLTVSEVTADAGTGTEGDITFLNIEFLAEYVGAQQWRSDY